MHDAYPRERLLPVTAERLLPITVEKNVYCLSPFTINAHQRKQLLSITVKEVDCASPQNSTTSYQLNKLNCLSPRSSAVPKNASTAYQRERLQPYKLGEKSTF